MLCRRVTAIECFGPWSLREAKDSMLYVLRSTAGKVNSSIVAEHDTTPASFEGRCMPSQSSGMPCGCPTTHLVSSLEFFHSLPKSASKSSGRPCCKASSPFCKPAALERRFPDRTLGHEKVMPTGIYSPKLTALSPLKNACSHLAFACTGYKRGCRTTHNAGRKIVAVGRICRRQDPLSI